MCISIVQSSFRSPKDALHLQHPVEARKDHRSMHMRRENTHIVHTDEEFLRIAGLRWRIGKSSQKVETSGTPGLMRISITAIWCSRVNIVPAEYHTVGLSLQYR